MRKQDQWKDGPGRMEYGKSVQLKAIGRDKHTPGMSKDHVRASFDVFGNHVETYWNLEDDEFTWNGQRHLGDKQKRYITFLTKLWSFVTYKDLRRE